MSIEKRVENNEIPENDLLDQAATVDPDGAADPFEYGQFDPTAVNEPDWVDQQIPVPIDEAEREER